MNSQTDQELRERVRKDFNGEYAVQICRGCGHYVTRQNGNVTQAVMVATCQKCFVPPEYDGYCEACRELGHDVCSMTEGCPCCDNTRQEMSRQ